MNNRLSTLARCVCVGALLSAAFGEPAPLRARAASANVVISEVLADPVGIEPDGEWIELYNLSGATVDLTNWKIGDEETQGGGEGMKQFPNGASIAAGQVIIVANQSAAFFAAYGFKPDYEIIESDAAVPNLMANAWGTGSVVLANDGDEVLLLDSANTLVDALSWGTSTFAFNPTLPMPMESHSLERRPANVDTDVAGNWFEQPFPAPGSVTNLTRVVTSAADSGPGTLRQALLDAGAGDLITFNISTFPPGNPTTINLLSSLPTINVNALTLDASAAGVILDGVNTPGAGLTLAASNARVFGFTVRRFPLAGVLILPGASNNIVGGNRASGQGNLIINNGGDGVEILGLGADRNRVLGNYIGIDSTGWWDFGNARNGVAVWQGAQANRIGEAASGYGNVISGNDHNGVWLGGSGTNANVVSGNFIGTRADGLGPVPNTLAGVAVHNGGQNNVIGGGAAGAGNLICGNAADGINVSDAGTTGTIILGNTIGPDVTGNRAIGQGRHGIMLVSGASYTAVGDGTAGGRNVISGNAQTGVIISGTTSVSNTVQGNFIGANISGASALPNGIHGVELTFDTSFNRVGGDRALGLGNVLSGNFNHGLVLSQGAHFNTVQGNTIGADVNGVYSLGNHPYGGMDVTTGAYQNDIGGLGAGEGNLISGNQTDGIALYDAPNNNVLGNLVGLTWDGQHALPNGGPGIFVISGASGTRVQGNTASGNLQDGIRLSGSTVYSVTVTGNRAGTDSTGTTLIPNGRYGILVSEGAHDSIVDNNIVRGNAVGGVAVITNTVTLPYGITVQANQIFENAGFGLWLEGCSGFAGNTLTQNSVYGNALAGIQGGCGAPPVLTALSLGPTETVTGTATPNARVEIFADADDEGQLYEGFTTADGAGNFTFSQVGGYSGPNVTAASTNANGDTTAFSAPTHLLWTMLLYLNGDNDLEGALRDTLDNLAAAGASPRTNVLALFDGYTTTLGYSSTVLYDVTAGTLTPIAATLGVSTSVPGELNMGDGQTLADFVNWGRAHYPARHTVLSIVDHGGGWAPSDSNVVVEGALLRHRRSWLSGNSGLSWDFTDDYDYLDSPEIRQALAASTNNGAQPLDVLFYDVCLMGMTEVAHQVQGYADYFVSSQNIGWSPEGPQGRYVRAVHAITATTTPRQMAELLVNSYAASMPPEGHPFTIAAVDLTQWPPFIAALDQLGLTLSETLTGPGSEALLRTVYDASQKVDYDGDFAIEPLTDGFVDVYDLALKASVAYTDPAVVNAAQTVMTTFNAALVAEQHRSDAPWVLPDRQWNLDGVHGLSIFLPLGEDLEMSSLITETSPITPGLTITRNLHLRDTYTSAQLEFVKDTHWGELIGRYYVVAALPVPTTTITGHVEGLLQPDVTPPTSTLTVTGWLMTGQMITVTWAATDTQTYVAGAALWQKPPGGEWTAVVTHAVAPTETVTGVFTFTLPAGGAQGVAVRGIDGAGNVEPVRPGENAVTLDVWARLYLPVVAR